MSNTLTDAIVHGNVIQARDILGGIHLKLPQIDQYATPQQLPRAPNLLVGRQAEFSALNTLKAIPHRGAHSSPAIAIVGSAGVGKTALALSWAHSVQNEFKDGCLYANLHGFDQSSPPTHPTTILAKFLRALGINSSRVPTDVDECAALFRTELIRRRLLIVADNAASSDQVRPLLPGGGSSVVIVTSRSRLDGLVASDDIRTIVLDVLDPDSAVALIGGVLGKERVAAEPAAALDVARLCGGLPLALRIAAARAAVRPRSRLLSLAENLQLQRLDFLRTPDDDPSGAVRSAWSLSYIALSDRDARVFRLMSLLPGSPSEVSAIAALTRQEIMSTQQSLDRLESLFMISAAELPDNGLNHTTHWGMHDLLKVYASELCKIHDSRETYMTAIGGLISWYIQRTEQVERIIWTGQPDRNERTSFYNYADAMAWWDREHSNAVECVGIAVSAGLADQAIRLTAAMYAPLYRRWQLADILDTHHQALNACPNEHPLAGRLHYGLGDAYSGLGSPAEALAHQTKALDLFQHNGERQFEARVLHGMGNSCLVLGEPTRSANYFRESLRIFEKVGDSHGVRHTFNGLANAMSAAGDYQESLSVYAVAQSHFFEDGDAHGEAHTLYHLAAAQLALDLHAEAATSCEEALARFAAEADHQMAGSCLYRFGTICVAMKRKDQAIEYYQAAKETFLQAGDRATADRVEARTNELLTGNELGAVSDPVRR